MKYHLLLIIFFSNVGADLNKKFRDDTDYKKFMKCDSVSSVYLTPIIPIEIKSELNDLKINKSSGPDDLPARIIKCIADDIVQPLCHIFNISITLYKDFMAVDEV